MEYFTVAQWIFALENFEFAHVMVQVEVALDQARRVQQFNLGGLLLNEALHKIFLVVHGRRDVGHAKVDFGIMEVWRYLISNIGNYEAPLATTGPVARFKEISIGAVQGRQLPSHFGLGANAVK